MSLTAADVAQIMRLVEQSAFDELTLEFEGLKLSLRRGGAASVGTPTAAAPVASVVRETTTGAAPASPPAASPLTTPSAPVDPALQPVAAPMLGTFYAAPKPGAPPFVQVGTVLEEDTVVAIIEVMKLMNSVRAGVRGTVAEIVAKDGSLVEYGETLLRVRKAPG